MAVRQIPIHNRSVTGKISVPGGVAPIRTESRLESDFVLVTQFDPTVAGIDGQPVRIDYLDETGAARHYTPDFLVRYFDPQTPPWLVEIKYRAHLDRYAAEYAQRFAAANRFAAERGWRFEVLTDDVFRTPLLSNVRFLLPFLRLRGDHPMRMCVWGQLQEMRLTTPRDLLDAITPLTERQAQLLPALWQLVAQRRVAVDLHAPLGMSSVIWPADIQAQP